MVQTNPFVIEGYKSPEYFCDRAIDTQLLSEHMRNQRNVALISKRRLGKSGLIHNLFYQEDIRRDYYTFYVDIYDTKNLAEFTYELGRCVFETLKSFGRQVWEGFVTIMRSLKLNVTFDMNGNPEWGVSMGDMNTPDVVLDEIFRYLESAGKPCIVALDEFQVIADYPEKSVEATLRKRIQNCKNTQFIYSGSKRHMMSEMFLSHARPFYNSTAVMGLNPIDKDIYLEFCNKHLKTRGLAIEAEAFFYLYEWSEGVTWYIQNVMNVLYSLPTGENVLHINDVDGAIATIIQRSAFAYRALLYQLAPKQKQVLYTIAKEGKAQQIMAQAFLKRHSLTASTVQGAVKILLERDFVTFDEGCYELCDKFFSMWLTNSKTS